MKKRYMHLSVYSLTYNTVVALLVPTDRFVRKYFYDMASEAALDATILCSNKQFTNRMKMTVLFPESKYLVRSLLAFKG